MRLKDGQFQLAATDLANFLACRHLIELERQVAEGHCQRPYRPNATLDAIRERGLIHENAYLDYLKSQSKSVVEIGTDGNGDTAGQTLQAMQDGADVIFQARLRHGAWGGYADFLVRSPVPSRLGAWSYEVQDTKLAQNTRSGAILQLCVYSDILTQLQGAAPQHIYVVKPGDPFTVERFRYADFSAYYRLMKRRLEQQLSAVPDPDSYPDPVAHCDICNWVDQCKGRRRADDHLTFVAGISKSQIGELHRQKVITLTSFATASQPLPEPPQRGSIETYEKSQRQARIQLKGKRAGRPTYEFLQVEKDRGFLRLPEPSLGDVFFDIEGDPHVPGGNFEYLFGYVIREGDRPDAYKSAWALDRHAEKAMFERFIDFLMERWQAHREMHVYHYAPYEPTALKRLATRHATRELELDELLRGQRLVDLYAVVRQGLRASVESYSIKKMEAFYGYDRLEELADARHALHRVERALEFSAPDEIIESDRKIVETYNQDDCLSTYHLRNWLEQRRNELIAQGHDVPRPTSKDGEPSDEAAKRNEEFERLFNDLIAGIPEEHRSDDEDARWLLAHMLEYFRREDKCDWWEYFRLSELSYDEFLDERAAISQLTFVEEFPPETKRSRCPTHRYHFPPQDSTIEIGKTVHAVGGDKLGTVVSIDQERGVIDIKKRLDAIARHPQAVFVFDLIRAAPLPDSLLAFGRDVVETVPSGQPIASARYDLLARRAPRLKTLSLPLNSEPVSAAITLARDLDHSILPIQGPPGAGKTHVGAHMIVDMARSGNRIGVTAVSHKVVLNLLQKVHEAAADHTIRLAHKGKKDADLPDFIDPLSDNEAAHTALVEGAVVGGTAWLWASDTMEGALDYLFIDEAGQMSLAMALAASRAAKNIVLLGDPQQLEQPQQGTHPEGASAAALSHLVGEAETLADNQGLFLKDTWRLHPKICEFTSELFYEGRLQSRDGLEHQEVFGDSQYTGSGLLYVPVPHAGNQNRSDEEVAVIGKIIEQVLDGNHQWSNATGNLQQITHEQVCIVAPYNAQVGALRAALPEGCRVGTVDKFQGQEAPIVIYSITSSSAADAPRGMTFLYSANRLNVATSRARCLVIMVGSPEVFEPECQQPHQMRLANAFCRYLELAESAREP